MAYLIGDGFDAYALSGDGTADVGAGGGWTGGNPVPISTNKTRFGYGKAIQVANSGSIYYYKTGGPNSSTWFVCLALIQTTALSGTSENACIQLFDGVPSPPTNANSTSSQVTILFRSDGAITVRSGHAAGTLIATFAGAFVANSFDHWQFKVVIHNTAGEVHVRKNGVTSDTFVATGLNTRGNTTNNYANCVGIGASLANFGQYVDDFLCFDNSGTTLFNDWVGDVRPYQLAPSFDTAQKQYAQNTTGSLAISFGSGTNTTSRSANVLYTGAASGGFSATQGGTLTSLTAVINAGFTGKAKLAIYDSNGDQAGFAPQSKPGRLLAVSDEVVNPALTQVFNFSTPLNIAKGRLYYPALLADAAWVSNAGLATQASYSVGISYATGFPADLTDVAPLTTGTVNGFVKLTGTLTATNAGIVSDDVQDAGTTFLSDPTVGHYDLWDVENLPYTPSKILGVVQRNFLAKSDAGLKGVKNVLKSGGTEYLSAEYNPLTTYGTFNTLWATDPATGANWAATGVNALQIGVKVTS